MKATVIVIGDEILLGRVTDTNSGFIARHLDREGIILEKVLTVGDKAESIRRAVDAALADSDLVFTTGGLGPTKDDITKRVLLERFGGELVRNADVTAHLHTWAARRGLKLNQLTLDQALVPSSAHVIVNRLGSAPIMVFSEGRKKLVTLPGVPFETEGMFPEVLAEVVTMCLGTAERRLHQTYILTGITESDLALRLEKFEDNLPEGYKLAYLPDSPIIKLRLDSCTTERFEEVSAKLEGLIESYLIGRGEKTIGQLVIERLNELKLTLATAESCTGGNIAHVITSVAGSSSVFNGGIVSYANSAKMNLLGVKASTLETYGAVSEQTVLRMADGAARALGTDCAVATSGIAGPGGGTPEKPVGTVWIGVHTPAGTTAMCYHFPGTRDRVIARATATALINLLKSCK